jgi:hypothetical protein
MIRSADSRAFDRQLKFATDRLGTDKSSFIYMSFPNENAWALPSGTLAQELSSTFPMSFARSISTLLLALMTASLMLMPFAIGLIYILSAQYKLEPDLVSLRYYTVILLDVLAFLLFINLSWINLIDRD